LALRTLSQTKHQIEALLAEAGSQPRHRFGQNFMIDRNLVRLVAEAGELSKTDWVLEVGPGTGTLTEELLERADKVVAVEIDRDLAALLRKRFAAHENFALIEGDALAGKHELNPQITEAMSGAAHVGLTRKLVANLPYNIASPLLIDLLIAGMDRLVFTVQKEVADRLRAVPGGEEYGPLSVMAQMLAQVQVLRTLPPQAFWPAPKIESALVVMVRNDRLGEQAREFGQFVHCLFSFRRKTLRKGLEQGGFDPQKLLLETALDPQARPQTLMPQDFLNLFQAVAK
jgi:16S rRNA (adenine1518-N6/adenine1519-N6)-dimethyltransferase